MGVDSHINIAKYVYIGDEVGVGIGTKIFTHGAYLSAFDGFPVKWGSVIIGSNVWLPHAWVNPGVVIGDNVVVSAMSLVNRNLPSGCLAGGIPVKILKKNVYPNKYTDWDEIIRDIYKDTVNIIGSSPMVGNTYFDIENRTITGSVTNWHRVFKNQLRRNGIRFRYKEENGEYVPW
jgi:NDP-sugar pyrophosphorylase family protein